MKEKNTLFCYLLDSQANEPSRSSGHVPSRFTPYKLRSSEPILAEGLICTGNFPHLGGRGLYCTGICLVETLVHESLTCSTGNKTSTHGEFE